MNKDRSHILIGQQEIADQLQISRYNVSRQCEKNPSKRTYSHIPASYKFGKYRISVGDLEDWMKR